MNSVITSAHLRREFKGLRVAMQSLDKTLRRLASVRVATPMSKESGRRFAVSPRRRAALILQGRYMGYMRQLKPRQKAQMRKLKEAKGVRAAIARARALAQ